MKFLILIICLAILIGGLLSPIPPYSPFPQGDKVMHCLGFFVVSLAARNVFIRTPTWLLWGALLVFAPISEILQKVLSPTRGFSLLDILANLTGIALAAMSWPILTRLYARWQTRKTK